MLLVRLGVALIMWSGGVNVNNSNKIMWWGYLHQNGSIQVKRWFGDHADYTTDCDGNDFIQQVVYPFEAQTYKQALQIITASVI